MKAPPNPTSNTQHRPASEGRGASHKRGPATQNWRERGSGRGSGSGGDPQASQGQNFHQIRSGAQPPSQPLGPDDQHNHRGGFGRGRGSNGRGRGQGQGGRGSLGRGRGNEEWRPTTHHAPNHPNQNSDNRVAAAPRPSILSPEVEKFWKRLCDSSDPGAISLSRAEDQRLWLQIWQAVTSGTTLKYKNKSTSDVLIRELISRSPTCAPPRDAIAKAIETFMNSSPFDNLTRANADDAETQLNNLMEAIESRVAGEGEIKNSKEMKSSIASISTRITSLMQSFVGLEHLTHIPKWIKTLNDLKGIHLPDDDHDNDHLPELDSETEPSEPWTQWFTGPTVGWLARGEFLNVPPLQNGYSECKDYSIMLLRMWTLLTFYWGAGAVWPKCRHQVSGPGGPAAITADGPKACGEPIAWLCHRSANCHRCGKNPAAWKCSRAGHNDSVCIPCLKAQQVELFGSGAHASTDVYDAKVCNLFSPSTFFFLFLYSGMPTL
jgi:hypothetical protein